MATPELPTIRIWCGVARQGVAACDLDQGIFFLDRVMADGKVSVVWDGHSYEGALQAAERWERAGCLVVDQVG